MLSYFVKSLRLPITAMLLFTSCYVSSVQKQSISYYASSGVYEYKNLYFVTLLTEVLKNTHTSTPTELSLVSEKLSQNRIVELMSSRCFADVIWLVSTDVRERQLLPIRTPLLKGLSGYRSLMIRKDKQSLFNTIKTEQQLALLSAGQGADWPDTAILQHNGYNVVPVSNFLALFDMLEDDRFDYFPRGVTEIAAELKHYVDKPLAVEANFMLYYPSPVYFFVCPQKPELARRISQGIEQAIVDGSFDRLFEQSHEYQSFIAAGGFNQKTIFSMTNPSLDPKTLTQNESLWLTP